MESQEARERGGRLETRGNLGLPARQGSMENVVQKETLESQGLLAGMDDWEELDLQGLRELLGPWWRGIRFRGHLVHLALTEPLVYQVLQDLRGRWGRVGSRDREGWQGSKVYRARLDLRERRVGLVTQGFLGLMGIRGTLEMLAS